MNARVYLVPPELVQFVSLVEGSQRYSSRLKLYCGHQIMADALAFDGEVMVIMRNEPWLGECTECVLQEITKESQDNAE